MITLSVTVALFASIARQDKASDDQPALQPAPSTPATVSDPMASFARLLPGVWRQTVLSGKSMYHTWQWGPGRHSIRRRTDGHGAAGQPWHELQVYYWHPDRKQIRVLGMSPYARGINEGTIRFEGETAEGDSDLYQSGGIHRSMGLRWSFDGQDKYRETLLEATGPGGLKPLVDFEHVRTEPAAVPRLRTVEGEKLSENLKAFEPLLGRVWEARGAWATGEAIHTRTTFEWVPIADAIYARVVAPTTSGEPTHLLDVYIYHHTGVKALRCLALTIQGGVYEGDLTEHDGGAFRIDLKGSEGDRVVQYAVRFDTEKDGTLRERAWVVADNERALLLDLRHKKLEPQKK